MLYGIYKNINAQFEVISENINAQFEVIYFSINALGHL